MHNRYGRTKVGNELSTTITCKDTFTSLSSILIMRLDTSQNFNMDGITPKPADATKYSSDLIATVNPHTNECCT
jgi:hypothetical protein